MDDGVGDRFARHRALRLHAGERSLRGNGSVEVLPRRVERGLILLARGVGLGLRGVGLRAEFVVGALRNVAGLEQIRVALGVGFGQARLGGRGIGIGFRGEHFGHAVGVELPALDQTDARLRLAQSGFGLLLVSLRLVEPQLRVAIFQTRDHLPLLDEIADIDRRLDHFAAGFRRDIRSLFCHEAAGDTHRSFHRQILGRHNGHGKS